VSAPEVYAWLEGILIVHNTFAVTPKYRSNTKTLYQCPLRDRKYGHGATILSHIQRPLLSARSTWAKWLHRVIGFNKWHILICASIALLGSLFRATSKGVLAGLFLMTKTMDLVTYFDCRGQLRWRGQGDGPTVSSVLGG
jgi:hypothetical protein